MSNETTSPVMAFDPGGTTGFAALASSGTVLFAAALTLDALEKFLVFLAHCDPEFEVVIEKGPEIRHNSPVTRRAEGMIKDRYPNAVLVEPSQWKGHPAARSVRTRLLRTIHEKDAASLARWFQITRRSKDGQTSSGDVSAGID